MEFQVKGREHQEAHPSVQPSRPPMDEKATSLSPEEAGTCTPEQGKEHQELDLPVQPSSESLSSAELPQGQSECPACQLSLHYPQRVTCCQRRFCRVCIEKLLKDGKPCPKCKEADFSALPDSDERLGLKSTYKDEGVGELASDLEEHPNSKPSPESQLDGCPQDHPFVQASKLLHHIRGRYDSEFVREQSECPICLQVLRDPQKVTCCGYIYCKVCIDRVVKDGKPCPKCNRAFSIFPYKGLRRTLGGFRVYCSNKDEGCEWVGELGDLERHLNSKPSPKSQLEGCLFEEVACIYCTCLFQRRYINPHQSNDECPKRPYVCKHCGHDATYEEVMQGHYQALVEVQSREPEQRADLLGCPLEIVTCDFHGVGCQVELPRRDVPAHLSRKVVSHSAFLLSTAQRTMSNVVTVQSGQNEMQAALARLQEVVTAQEDKNRRLQERQRSTNARLQKINLRQSQALFWGLSLVLALAAIGIGIAVGNVRDEQMASAESKPESFPVDSGIQVNESENMTVALAQTLELVKQELAIEKSAREEMAKFLAQVEKEVATGKRERDIINGSLNELDYKISMRGTVDSTTSTSEKSNNTADDKIIEKIEMKQSAVMRHLKMIPHEVVLPFEFTMDKFQEYKTENEMWYSPPFYTHSHGYTLCIDVRAFRIDPNISVYAYLMLGAFDEDLNWPFRGNVTIELVNQAESSRFNPISYVSSRKKSHVRSFDFANTDPRINRRVTMSKRAKLGQVIHHFIAHSALDYDAVEGTQYLKDDSLKFRISKVTNIL